jgi:hypothetical protein
MNVGGGSGRGAARALALLALLAVPLPGCGHKEKAVKHHAEEGPAISSPTPDNTPVPALRTPAGLVLKLDEPTPPPAPATTPTAAVSPNPAR